MTNVQKFVQLSTLFKKVEAKREKEYKDFMDFYRSLVETLPSDVCKAFGKFSVEMNFKADLTIRTASGNVAAGATAGNAQWGILLSVADYMWWVDKFNEPKIRFKLSPSEVKSGMLQHLATAVESLNTLDAAERKELLKILLDD